MDVPRVRIGAVLEWMVAAGCIVAAAGLTSRAIVQLRDLRAVTPVIAETRAVPETPAAVAPGAVLVPILLLSTGVELRVGDNASVLEALDPGWQIGTDAVERTRDGERTVRRYDDGSTQFAVVLKPAGAGGRRSEIAAIYLR